MKTTALLIILLSNQGYWIGGREGTINIRPAARGGLPAADVSWDLMFESVKVSSGVAALAQGDNPIVIRIKPPQCRQRISLDFKYRLLARGLGRELASGDEPIHLFPDDIAKGLASRIGSRKLYVWDNAKGIPALLDREKVRYVRIDGESQLEFSDADVVLVGPDMIEDSLFAQSSLMALARSGSSVMLFNQTRPQRLMGYDLQRRSRPAKFEWRREHPLLRGFETDDLESFVLAGDDFSVLRLTADDPALELAYYPPEIPGTKLGPLDVVLITSSVGTGRFVVSELKIGDWLDDPRSQMFLRNAMDYLLAPADPTPGRASRNAARPPAAPWVATIPVSNGGP